MNESQKIASVSAQSAGDVHGLPWPTGGRWQTDMALQA
jgi:hypothetical protein